MNTFSSDSRLRIPEKFSGLIETSIKSATLHIKGIIGTMHLTYEELSTIFVQVEAILNSLPLRPLSSSPDDLSPLSTEHFPIGRPLAALPSPNLEEANHNRLHRFAKKEQGRQYFGPGGARSTFAELQQPTKWPVRHPNLQLGQLVLVKQAHSSPLAWPLESIVKLHTSSDELCCVADIKTNKGIVRRSISCICPLLDEKINSPSDSC